MSITKSQVSAIADGFLDNLGESKQDLSGLPILEKVLAIFAKDFITEATANLERSGAIDTGALQRDLTFSLDFDEAGNTYTINVGYPANSKTAEYYDFVNKGVRGVKSGNLAPGSPYQFKTVYPGQSLTKAIEQWVTRHSIASRNEDQKYNLSKHQAKRQSVGKMASAMEQQHSLAYAIASSIKRRGLKKTGYFDKAVDSVFGAEFKESLARAIGADVQVMIRQLNTNQ